MWKRLKIRKNQTLTNVMTFVQEELLTIRLWKRKGYSAVAGLSALFELLRSLTNRRLCEFGDVFQNMISAVIGAALVITLNKIKG